MKKCIFLDRDGVINKDKVDYVYHPKDVNILDGVPEAIQLFRQAGYMIVVITNQSGIDKGIFTHDDVAKTHAEINHRCGGGIDAFYYSPFHRTLTRSLATKPGSLMFEKAIAKYNIDPAQSWMVGDRVRDLEPAHSLGIDTVLIEGDYEEIYSGKKCNSLLEAARMYIMK